MASWRRWLMLLTVVSSLKVLLAIPVNSMSINGGGFKATLRRVDFNRNFTTLERLQRAMNRGLSAQRLAAVNHNVRSTVIPVPGEFLIELGFGSPPVWLDYIMDTGSDMIWTHCLENNSGSTDDYNPQTSSSFSELPCSDHICNTTALPSLSCDNNSSVCAFNITYGSGRTNEGKIGRDSITFGNNFTAPNVIFGCGHVHDRTGQPQPPPAGSSGIVGLGRGKMSLISQAKIPIFWYCLPGMASLTQSTGPLGGGGNNKPMIAAGYLQEVKTTPLLPNDTHYSIRLKGISVGDKRLHLPEAEFQSNPDGSSGIVVDSGTPLTYLQPKVFAALKEELISQVGVKEFGAGAAITGLDLCFTMPLQSDDKIFPKLTFHFDGGLDLELPKENYFVDLETLNMSCLAMLNTSNTGGMTIFGNIQQQNMNVTYDLTQNTLSFKPEQCDQAS
ncbi:unnamed protein product [Cuscuta europaea]|uniref:Peptidase A1 domain-containing protein n=1 Tax=Cuscuta europaea TaxID=41803 RepID=A0A9P0ZBN6_CUSEU|nr:unnamed protein product [Cuscuta europaea]